MHCLQHNGSDCGTEFTESPCMWNEAKALERGNDCQITVIISLISSEAERFDHSIFFFICMCSEISMEAISHNTNPVQFVALF